MSHDDDRIGYLAGDGGESLAADERAGLDELRSLLQDPAVWEEPAPDLEERVVAAVADEARGRPPVVRERSRRRARRLRPAHAFGAVALGAAAAVLAFLAVGHGGPAAQRFRMEVAGTSLAPGVHGRATLTKSGSGWRIDLRAPGLPGLANGRYYQAWLKNAAGVLVPVGTFNDADRVTLWAGVKPVDFPTLTVTEQRAGRGQASSGRRVLTGTLPGGG